MRPPNQIVARCPSKLLTPHCGTPLRCVSRSSAAGLTSLAESVGLLEDSRHEHPTLVSHGEEVDSDVDLDQPIAVPIAVFELSQPSVGWRTVLTTGCEPVVK